MTLSDCVLHEYSSYAVTTGVMSHVPHYNTTYCGSPNWYNHPYSQTHDVILQIVKWVLFVTNLIWTENSTTVHRSGVLLIYTPTNHATHHFTQPN